jgi:hypothetical protein
LEGEWGLVVVDQTEGIYPLILYSKKRKKEEGEERITAFQKSLNEVIEKFELIYSYFKDHTRDSWNREFQEGLFESAGFTSL